MLRYDSPFTGQTLANGLFYSVVTALIVSLFYDIGVRRDISTLLSEERRLFMERLLEHVDVDLLSQGDRGILARRISTSEQMMTQVATNLLGEHGNSFYHTWLRPLVERRMLESVDVEHRLRRFPDRDDLYVMEFRQRFRAPAGKRRFVVVFTCDNDLYNSLITSGARTDELVGTPTEDWATIDAQLRDFAFLAYRSRAGRRESRTAEPRQLSDAELSELLERPIGRNRVRGLEYEVATNGDWTFEYSYRLTYRLSDPYYYWTAVNPMLVHRITFDYRELKPLVGRVSANCVLGSAAGEPQHDEASGRYTLDVDSLVWPGQGAMLVWRPQPATGAAQSQS